jgi:tRNA-dihydrouridine synthase B
MIGRAALGNPFIFREALELLDRGESIPPPSSSERIMTAVIHLDLVCKFKGEEVAVREMRKHFSWYMRGLKGASKLRQQINQCRTRDELIDAISLLQGI